MPRRRTAPVEETAEVAAPVEVAPVPAEVQAPAPVAAPVPSLPADAIRTEVVELNGKLYRKYWRNNGTTDLQLID